MVTDNVCIGVFFELTNYPHFLGTSHINYRIIKIKLMFIAFNRVYTLFYAFQNKTPICFHCPQVLRVST